MYTIPEWGGVYPPTTVTVTGLKSHHTIPIANNPTLIDMAVGGPYGVCHTYGTI